MKNHSAIQEVLEQDHAVFAQPELVIDWNMNRYVGCFVDNDPHEEDEGYEVEIFPLESIVEPLRPTKGINKARIDSSVTGNDYNAYSRALVPGRFYIADNEDPYKYWTSPRLSDSSGNITGVSPFVVYHRAVEVNKLVITTENTWASAKTFEIQTTTEEDPTNSQWTTVATNSSVGTAWKNTGQIVLYWTGSAWAVGTRNDNEDLTPKTTTIRGVRVVVTQLEGGFQKTSDGSLVRTDYISYDPVTKQEFRRLPQGTSSHFDLIEISARLEVNLSDFLISTSSTFDMGERSSLYPIGTVTTNQGSVSLSNLYQDEEGNWKTGYFYSENSESPYADYIDANAQVTLNYIYTDDDGNVIGKVQDFTLYADSWTGQSSDTVSIELSDYSKFFNTAEAKLRSAMWENLKVSQIVWRILDSVGFVDYQIDTDIDLETDHTIPVFYTDGEKNVWEVLNELSLASQTAIYFDSYGKLQVKTRKFAYSPTNAPVTTFTSVNSENYLENIANLDINSEFEPNFYRVTYQKTNWDKVVRGVPTMQQVWTPEDTVTLRAASLIKDMGTSTDYLWIPSGDVSYWPYDSIVNVEGEIIKYEGKVYVYYTGANGNTRNTRLIKSQDEFNSRNSKTPVQFRHKNHFNGALKVVERGIWSSEAKPHKVDADGYSVRQFQNDKVVNVKSGFRHRKAESRVELVSGPLFANRSDMILATTGTVGGTAYYNYGTRFRFLKQEGRTNQLGGIVIHNTGSKEDGYYFEFMPSRFLTATNRDTRDEFIFYKREAGKDKILGKSPCAIGENIDYEMDVEFRVVGGNHRIRVWLNGKTILSRTVSGADRMAATGKFGMFARGRTRIEYEYLYALARPEQSDMLEDFSFLDKVERGYRGSQWDREWVYDWRNYKKRTRKVIKRVKRKNGTFLIEQYGWKKATRRFNRQFFDEFGPIVHEVREFDVAFEPAPVQHSRLYLSNDWAAVALEYRSNPFGATFFLANTSRFNAVVNGEDRLSFSGTGDSIDQVLTVFGRALKIEESEEVEASNEDQIRRRGKVESEISSEWIQSKAMANDIANWLKNNFSKGNENITLEVFGNPLVELTDVVRVVYPEKHIDGDYFVVSIENGFETGLTTSLTLRRRDPLD